MEVPATGAVFTEDELRRKAVKALIKHYPQRQRSIALGRDLYGAHLLSLQGPGVPGTVHVTCETMHVNLLARLMLDGYYDVSLVYGNDLVD